MILENDFKDEEDPKNENDPKEKHNLKNEDDLKNSITWPKLIQAQPCNQLVLAHSPKVKL